MNQPWTYNEKTKSYDVTPDPNAAPGELDAYLKKGGVQPGSVLMNGLNPDVNSSVQGGNSLVPTPGGNNAIPPPMKTPTLDDPSQVPTGSSGQLPPTSQTAQNPGPQPGAAKVPLSLYGKSNYDQARELTTYFKSIGVDPGNFTVGGTSPYDPQINNLIDRINDPSTTPEMRKMYAQEMVGLFSARNKTVQGGEFDYNSQTMAPGPPNQKTPEQLVGGLTNGPQPTPNATPITQPRKTDPRLYDLINEFIQGGTFSKANEQAQEGQLISDIEGAAKNRKQGLADQYSAQGIQGGQLQDRLGQVDAGALSDRSHGLLDLRTTFADKQQASKGAALNALLGGDNLDSSEAQQYNSLMTQRQIEQANLGQQNEQFNKNLELNQNSQGLVQRQQDINGLISLLQLASQGDEAAKQRIMDILNNYGGLNVPQ